MFHGNNICVFLSCYECNLLILVHYRTIVFGFMYHEEHFLSNFDDLTRTAVINSE